jgi:hypothetical protein
MTNDEITRMAKEAGGQDWGIFRDFMPELERFANLVAAAERERIVEILRDDGWLYCATMIGLRKK